MATVKISGKKSTQTIDYNAFVESTTKYELTQTRSIEDLHEHDIDKGDVLELEYSDGTTWVGTMSDINAIKGIVPQSRDAQNTNELVLPLVLTGANGTRGLGNIILKALTVFKIVKDVKIIAEPIHNVIDSLEDLIKKDEGVFILDKQFKQTKITGTIPQSDKPYLLFLHGTLSDTDGSFGELVKTTDGNAWTKITDKYQQNILTLEHKTLSKSPLENLLNLVEHFPENITLHVISHSRGGIIGDLLCFYNSQYYKGSLKDYIHEDRAIDLECIGKIESILKNKKIVIDKFVRVACPAAGTTLLSDRPEKYLNALSNIIKYFVPGSALVTDVIKKIIITIISYKDNNIVLPGLEAMVPNSDFQKMLNNRACTISAPLTVIKGDGKVSLSLKGLGTILFNLFYLHDNDWIVDTDSMNKGLFRKNDTYFFITQHAQVNHFSYFKNNDSRTAILNVLNNVTGLPVTGFEPIVYNDGATDTRGAGIKLLTGDKVEPNENNITGNRPILILLPGILGSNLSEVKNGDVNGIYLNLAKIAAGGLVNKLGIDKPNIKATSVIGAFYRKFVEFYSRDFDVDVFPYDWRISIEESAKLLAAKIKAYAAKNQPIKLVAHSMGGLVVRHFVMNSIQSKDGLYERISGNADFKLVFLGSPLKGSYLIPEVLTGIGSRIQQLATIDLAHNVETVQNTVSGFTGLCNMLPMFGDRDFVSSTVWDEMKNNSTKYNWTVPDEGVMSNFKEYVASIIKFENELAIDFYANKNILYLAGHAEETVCDYTIDQNIPHSNKLRFITTNRGDGSVTWDSGIPKQLIEAKRVFYVNTSHGDLANDEDNFSGILDILKTGTTDKLQQTEPVNRSAKEELSYAKDRAIFKEDELSIIGELMGSKTKPAAPAIEKLKLKISCGDLYYTKFPILVGHFKNDGIISAEKAVDKYLKNKLTQKYALNLYPGDVGTNEVFLNSKNQVSAIIVGLGVPDKLSGSQLAKTITQGAVNYLLAKNNSGTKDASIGISSVLIGSSYAGLSLDTSIKAIISGIQKANSIIKNNNPTYSLIETVELIDYYEDRAIQALRFINQESDSGRLAQTELITNSIEKKLGRRRRIVYENNDEWWNNLSILRSDKSLFTNDHFKEFNFTASSGTAKSDVRSIVYDTAIINKLLDELAENKLWDAELAKIIFELLIPNDFKLSVRNLQNIILMLDKDSAQIPWELLHDTKTEQKPLATQIGMIRQLTTTDASVNVNYSTKNNALVIGEPDTDGFMQPLPKAKIEAEEVIKKFLEYAIATEPSINESGTSIIKKLFKDEYKILHLAGHGDYNASNPLESGMIIGDKLFLSANTIKQLPAIPDLVFINCCHIGKVDAKDYSNSYSRLKLAATLGTQLIEMGVKCVVAAAWAVDDSAALNFAKVFYDKMLNGSDFGEAVHCARENTYDLYPYNNTWAAYQCYGNQFYTLNDNYYQVKKAYQFYDEEEVKVHIQNLLNSIETNKDSVEEITEKIKDIEDGLVNSSIGNNSIINYLLAKAYLEIRNYGAAIKLLQSVVASQKGDYPVDALERLCLIKYKKYAVDAKENKPSTIKIDEVIGTLKDLIKLNPSAERYNLLAAVYKVKAQFTTSKSTNTFLDKAVENYRTALEIMKKNKANSIYPLANAIAIDIAMNIHDSKKVKVLKTELKDEYTNCKPYLDPYNFWDMMAEANVNLCKLLIEPTVKENYKNLETSISKAWETAGTENKKQSELEHIDFLIKIYTDAKGDKQVQRLTDLKTFLSQLKDADKIELIF